MKKRSLYITLAFVVMTAAGCKKYLDINSDPDTTQVPSVSSVLPQCIASIPTALQPDGGLYVAKYIQNWLVSANTGTLTYDQQGYVWSGGTMAATWQMTYYAMGNNINYIHENAIRDSMWEYAGVATALKAWSFQHTTDYNSDIIFYSAYKPDTFSFKYETQETMYRVVDSMCRQALIYFDMITNPTLSATRLSRGDLVYSGGIDSWRRFVYGVLARNWHHLTNKSFYNADSVIKYCDNAMTNVSGDFVIPFDATVNNNSNYYGTFRDNMGTLRPSNYIVKLLDGTTLAGSNVAANRDPRLGYMLSASQDTTNGNGGYRGVDPAQGDPNITLTGTYAVNSTNWINARKRVATAWGDSIYANPSPGIFNPSTGKFLFQNKAVYPLMTYAEMQFIKAEAALRKGNKALAYTAYLNGINAHFDFINRSYSGIRSSVSLCGNTPIPAAARAKYLAGANVKQIASDLTITDIMLQKYIALWGWGFFETWVDMRRFHYTDVDVITNTNTQVYKGFVIPTLSSSNLGKTVQRVRPHFTSEYTYNLSELQRIGALQQDYHTKEMWFSIKQ